jgi:hypothetical protein
MKDALKTHLAGVMISEETTMNYNSPQPEWWGDRNGSFIIGRKEIRLVTSHLGQCTGELVARKHVFIHVERWFIILVDFRA